MEGVLPDQKKNWNRHIDQTNGTYLFHGISMLSYAKTDDIS